MSQHPRPIKSPASLRRRAAIGQDRANAGQQVEPGRLRAGQALTLAVALASGSAVVHAASDDAARPGPIEEIVVRAPYIGSNPYAQPGAPYKGARSGDPRHKRPIAETPQNIAVLTKAQIEDSGYTDLREILDAQPGITLGTGENGNAFGDRYVIRGQEARSDVFVDGLRDPGMTIRESFATEQVEISKGPNSSFAGRGTAGGAINSITKQATTSSIFSQVSAAAGSDEHSRYTVDGNLPLTSSLAVRANALHAYEEVPDRAPTDRERKGLALSTIYQPTDAFDVIVDYYGMEAEDNPDLGGYLVNRKPADDVPVYAQRQDFLESTVDVFTARLRYEFQPDLYVMNATRFGTTDNGYVVTGARGATTDVTNPDGVYPTSTLSTHQGWQEVEYLVNQTNLFADLSFGGLLHELIFSVEWSDHQVVNGLYNVATSGQNCIVPGRFGPPGPAWCATGPDGRPVSGLDRIMNRQIGKAGWDQDWRAQTRSLAVMDTVDLTENVTLFAGVRYDDTELELETRNAQQLQTGDYDYADGMWNGHLGLTWQFRPDANVYLTWSSAADINGGESDVGTSGGYGGLVTFNGEAAGAEPESTNNLELGTKWNLVDDKLLLTASVFQIDKSDVMEGADYASAGTFNTGENRVRGVEVSASGSVTEKLMVQAGYTVMDAEVRESFNPANEGRTLSNFADNTGFAQVRYEVTDKLALGGAMKYESKKYAGQPDSAAAFDPTTGRYSQPVPSYAVYDLFGTYVVNDHLDLRLNVGNVTDEEYYLAAYRSGSFLYLGDARNVRFTVNYEF